MKTYYYDVTYGKNQIPKLVVKGQLSSEINNLVSNDYELKLFIAKAIYKRMPTEEHIYLLSFNTQYVCSGIFEISHGSICMSVCDIRAILLRLVLINAASYVIVHNHPSGDSKFSDCDMQTYNRCIQASSIVGIQLLGFAVWGSSMQLAREGSAIVTI